MAIYQNVYKALYPYQIDHQFHPLISAHAVMCNFTGEVRRKVLVIVVM